MSARRRLPFVFAAGLVSTAAGAGPPQPASCLREPAPCPVGLVWREAVPDDYVCVTPGVRDRTRQENDRAAQLHETGPGASGPDTCHQGYVWRGAFAGDVVCVCPEERDLVAADNRTSAERTSPLQQGPHGPNVCRQGSVWRDARPGDVVCVDPKRRDQAHRDNALAASRRGNDVCLPGSVGRAAVYGDVACVRPAERDQAAQDTACSQYAWSVAAQLQTKFGRGCQLFGSRWSPDLAGHFAWCTTASAAQRDAEQRAREVDLVSCPQASSGNGGPNPGPGGSTQCCWTGGQGPFGPGAEHRCGPVCPCGPGNCH